MESPHELRELSEDRLITIRTILASANRTMDISGRLYGENVERIRAIDDEMKRRTAERED